MSDVDARYLGLTANQLAKIATDLKAENDKLREEVEQWHRLTAGIELPEYPVTEFHPKDLERENARLRELGGFMLRCMLQYHGHCDYCLVNGEHCDITYIESDAQELGIEVGS